VGEWFYTSGEDRIFPRGLPVGWVKKVGGDKTYKEILLVPSGPSRGMEELLVVLEGVHQSLPAEPATAGSAPLLAPPAGPPAVPAAGAAQAAGPGTEADRLLEKYRKSAESRGGAYGDNPESRKPPQAAPTPAAPRPAKVKP
jgi:rod shape-determining protein MreC